MKSALDGGRSELRIGMLGAGMIASFAWGVLPGMHAVDPRARIVAIAAPTRTHSEPLAHEYGIPDVYDSLDAMLCAGGLDAILNLTPIPAHYETSKAILEAGLDLITEKPVSSTVQQADRLVELANAHGSVVVCSPPRMLEPQRRRARELVRAGAIGRVAFARVRSSHAGPAAQAWPADPSWFYAAGAGRLLDMGAYGIQEITGIFGPARRVTALSGRLAGERRAYGGAFDGVTIPVTVDDNALLLLDFGDSVFAVVDASFSVRAARSPALEIFGLEGSIALADLRADAAGVPVELYRVASDGIAGEWVDASGDGFAERQARVRAMGRAALVQHYVECALDGAENELTLDRARHTLEIMIAAQESAESGRAIELTTRW
jgi:predicted dehydrogenase